MRTAAVLTRAGTPTVTADVKLFARTGNTGTGRSVSLRSAHAKHLTTASKETIVLTILADRDAPSMKTAKGLTKPVKTAFAVILVTTILALTQDIPAVRAQALLLMEISMDIIVNARTLPVEKVMVAIH